jgi:signal transduction histidine kinase
MDRPNKGLASIKFQLYLLVCGLLALSVAVFLFYSWLSSQDRAHSGAVNYHLATLHAIDTIRRELVAINTTGHAAVAAGTGSQGTLKSALRASAHVVRHNFQSITKMQRSFSDPAFPATLKRAGKRLRKVLKFLDGGVVSGRRYRDFIETDLHYFFQSLDQLGRLHLIAYQEETGAAEKSHRANRINLLSFIGFIILLGGIFVYRTIRAVRVAIDRQRQAEQDLTGFNQELEQRVEERTEELHQAQKELLRKERLATLGQLTGTVSHELRNPLAVMRTSTHILRSLSADAKPQAARAVDRLERSITRCDHIVDELLDYTRISNMEPRPMGLDGWLAETLAELEVPEGVTLNTSLGLDGATIPIDAERLRRAVINVFDNACQAMAEAGRLATLTVTTQARNGRAEITIADTGPGISGDILPHIFEPLFSTRNFGVGLGLPVVKQIMEQHGGGVSIDTHEGQGTCFTLWLPMTGGEDGEHMPPPEAAVELGSATP